MTVQEFINKNKDILCGEISPDRLLTLEQGSVVFYISTPSGNKPKYDRQISAAGYRLVVHHAFIKDGKPEYVDLLGLTNSGYAKIDYISPAELSNTGTKTLFWCKPIEMSDPRFNKTWSEWPT